MASTAAPDRLQRNYRVRMTDLTRDEDTIATELVFSTYSRVVRLSQTLSKSTGREDFLRLFILPFNGDHRTFSLEPSSDAIRLEPPKAGVTDR
jgi:hypothetical protein